MYDFDNMVLSFRLLMVYDLYVFRPSLSDRPVSLPSDVFLLYFSVPSSGFIFPVLTLHFLRVLDLSVFVCIFRVLSIAHNSEGHLVDFPMDPHN